MRTTRRHERRGNAMILVAGVLVLLVIIATAYITRTQAGRVTAVAVRQSESAAGNADVIGETLAQHVADALFVFPAPTEPSVAGFGDPWWNFDRKTINSNLPRLRPERDAPRYGFDSTWPYNFAPYHVVPWTNWPDTADDRHDFGLTFDPWPQGAGAPSGRNLGEGNPVGNPGYGDTRWLRDLEPLRWSTDIAADFNDEAFKYWRHLSYIAHPNNGFRLVKDAADVFNTDAFTDIGGIQIDLNLPVEQWLTSDPTVQPDPAFFSNLTGETIYNPSSPNLLTGIATDSDFILRWDNWFETYPLAYRNEDLAGNYVPSVPPNFFHLKNLDGDEEYLEPGERPADEFVRGTARWDISRVLTDTDGDGFTDAYWFLAPSSSEDGIRQLVAVSIVDNSGMFNGNGASQYLAGGPPDSEYQEPTVGETPADRAMWAPVVDDNPSGPDTGNWNVGFFDARLNWEYLFDFPPETPPSGGGQFRMYNPNSEEIGWSNLRWDDYLAGMGVFTEDHQSTQYFPDARPLATQYARRQFWLFGGNRPFSAQLGLTPFTLSDELELRAYHGQNWPENFSQYEWAVNTSTGATAASFLRSSTGYEETVPYLDQLNNPELMRDHRRKTTLFSNSRNDLLPPWLWWRRGLTENSADEAFPTPIFRVDDAGNVLPCELYPNGVGTYVGLPTAQRIKRNFIEQSRMKLDLREANPIYRFNYRGLIPGTPGDPTEILGYDGTGSTWDGNGMRLLHERLPWMVLLAFAEGDEEGELRKDNNGAPKGNAESFVGDYGGSGGGGKILELRRLAASFTANLLAYRDDDDGVPYRGNPADVGDSDPDEFRFSAPLYDDLDVTLPGSTGQVGAVPLPEWNMDNKVDGELFDRDHSVDWSTRFLGLERQPFLLEAFIAHVHDIYTIPDGYFESRPGTTTRILLYNERESGGSSSLTSTITAVQIANPFDEPIVLYDPTAPVVTPIDRPRYAVRVGDTGVAAEPVSLWGLGQYIHRRDGYAANEPVVLPPARDDRPVTMIIYSMEGANNAEVLGSSEFRERWEDFLDIRWESGEDDQPWLDINRDGVPDPDKRPLVVNLQDALVANAITADQVWSTDRKDYDEAGVTRDMKIELIRQYPAPPTNPTPTIDVVIDRLDESETGSFSDEFEEIGDMNNDLRPPEWTTGPSPVGFEPPPPAPPGGGGALPSFFENGSEYANIWEVQDSSPQASHWVQFVRVARRWGVDSDGSLASEPDERNPRYVFANKVITTIGDEEGITDADITAPYNNRFTTIYELSLDPRGTEYLKRALLGTTIDGEYRAARGIGFVLNEEPDGDPAAGVPPWFTMRYRPSWDPSIPGLDPVANEAAKKPVAFDMSHNFLRDVVLSEGIGEWRLPEKGFYPDLVADTFADAWRFSMQMTQKDGDFQQVGEVLNVWLWTHELEFEDSDDPSGDYVETTKTFSEHMRNELSESDKSEQRYANRLEMRRGPVLGRGATMTVADPMHPPAQDPQHALPALPAAARLLDAFVCDGPGFNYNPNNILGISVDDVRFGNASGFTGRPTWGLVNVNTAPIEVLRTLPNWYKLIHQDIRFDNLNRNGERFPRTGVAESLINYREGFSGNFRFQPGVFDWIGREFGYIGGPNFYNRVIKDYTSSVLLRDDRGLASLGELGLLVNEPTLEFGGAPPPFIGPGGFADLQFHLEYDATTDEWLSNPFSIQFAAENPFEIMLNEGQSAPEDFRYGAFLSTDVVGHTDPLPFAGYTDYSVDGIAADSEEANMILSGASNLITTRSDTFTVYFRIRSFRKNPATGVWDATDPEHIVEDSRYVMLVDRSNVNKPGDKPRILYLEKMPN